MAIEVGMRYREIEDEFHSGYADGVYLDELEAFAKLVAAKKQEQCAQFCEAQYEFYGYDHVFAAGIRALK